MAILTNNQRTVNQVMLQAARAASFNANGWKPVGEKIPLKKIWDAEDPTLWGQIEGDTATIVTKIFDNGSIGKRICIPLKGEDEPYELTLNGKSELSDGDTVKVESIFGQMLKKPGRDMIMRFDADVE